MKKRLWLILTIASGVSLSGAAAPTGWTTAYAAAPTLTQGAHGDAVAKLQAALNRLGYHVGTVDGIFGPVTRRAVMAFQRAQHLAVDGVVGAQTWAALGHVLSASAGSAAPTSRSGGAAVKTSLVAPAMPPKTSASIPYPGMLLRIGSHGAAVKALQQRLNQLGFRCGAADGVFGSATQAAVKAFQKSQHLTPDGVVGRATWAKLFPQPALSSKPQSPVPGKTGSGSTSGPTSGSAPRTSRSGVTTPGTPPSGNQSTPGNGTGNGRGSTSGSPSGSGPSGSSTNSPAYIEIHMRLGSGPNGPAVMSGFQTLNDAAAKAVADAKDDLSHRLPPEAFVVKAADQTLQTLPIDYFYLSPSGQWMHHGQDWTNTIFNVSVGQAPAWARQGELYVGLDTGVPPFYAHFYRIGTFDPSAGVPSQFTSIRLAIQDEGVYENPYRSVDLRYPAPSQVTGTVIDQWLGAQGSPMVGLGAAFVNAQSLYGVNAVYLAAHAVHESGPVRLWTPSSIPVQKNNLFGYQAYDNNTAAAAVFPSEEYSIRFEAWFVRNWYLNPGAVYSYKWPTLDGMNRYYATDRNWSSAVATYMEFLGDSAGLHSQTFISYPASTAVPEPSLEREPVYLLGPASAVIAQDAKALSDYQMRPELVLGAQGYWVKQLQTQLNNYFQKTQGIAPLAVDGDFGPSTLDRLKMFQQSVGLVADGDCGPKTWAALFPVQSVTLQKGTAVTVDQIELGTGGLMYHVVTAQNQTGWVDGAHLTLKNVYKVKFSSTYNVKVPGTEDMLHVGDWVVLSGNQLWYVDQMSGTVKSAVVDPTWAVAWLVQVTQS